MSSTESARSSTFEQFPVTPTPEGWEPIREDEFMRLPEYAIELITSSMNGMLENVTREELIETMHRFFENSSNSEISTSAQIESLNNENESSGGHHSPAGGTVHSLEQ